MTYTLKIMLLLISLIFMCCSDATKSPDDNTNQHSGTKFEPPDGERLFILGQADEDEMRNYISTVKSDPLPAGFAFYTSLSNGAIQADLPRYKNFMDDYPNTVLQLAIWTGERQEGDPGYYLDDIVAGKMDQNILALAQACKNFGKPIFIRFGYEFDGWHNAYPPDKYKTAYTYFVDRMNGLEVTNVAYVWHSWGVGAYYGSDDFPQYYPALPSGQINQELWYPGDAYVDWVAMSVFGSGWGDLNTNSTVQYLIDFAANHDKPVMLAETAAIKTSGQSDPDWVIQSKDWFNHIFSLCDNNTSIKAFTYINVDWEGDNPSSTWGDTRIQVADVFVRAYWLQQIKDFLHADSDLYARIGYQ